MGCNTIGERIAHLRKVKGISQGDLAKAMYVKREVVTHWEVGDRDLKTEYTIKLADYFGVTCDYLLRGIPAEDIEIAKVTGLNSQSIQIIKDIASWSRMSHNPNFSNGLNDFICSGHFAQLITQYIGYKRAVDILEYRLEVFRNWLAEHEVKPPKNILAYAHKLAIEQQTPVAVDVANSQEDVRYAQFKMQRILDLITNDTQNGGENCGINP